MAFNKCEVGSAAADSDRKLVGTNRSLSDGESGWAFTGSLGRDNIFLSGANQLRDWGRARKT